MPEETIGICKCLNTLDKNLYIILLEDGIKDTKTEIEDLEQAPYSKVAKYEYPEVLKNQLLSLKKQHLVDMENVLERVSKVSECD